MTDEEIAVEYEAYLAFTGEQKKECPKCKRETFRENCPHCVLDNGEAILLTGDHKIDDVLSKLEAGEKIDNLEEILRGGFQPVSRGKEC
jgi:hypothetical protein